MDEDGNLVKSCGGTEVGVMESTIVHMEVELMDSTIVHRMTEMRCFAVVHLEKGWFYGNLVLC